MSTLSFESFWTWLVQHPNCVVRAGTADAAVYDDEDLHWYLGPDGQILVAQAIRGKRLVGEVVLDPERVAYVQDMGEQRQGEHLFELIAETENDRYVAYYFLLTHGLEDEAEKAQQQAHGPAVH